MSPQHTFSVTLSQSLRVTAHALLGATLVINPGFIQQVQATTIALADGSVLSSSAVPGNLALTLSVEHPTASTPSYKGAYSASNTYLGYFNPKKCYVYNKASSSPETNSYFEATTTDGSSKTCSGTNEWSGNFMNWASMQSLDTFRWVLTGGNRVKDTTTETVLQKTFAAINGADLAQDSTKTITSTNISNTTPLGWSTLKLSIGNRGTAMYFSCGNVSDTATEYTGTGSPSCATSPSSSLKTYFVYVNVKVCEAAPDANNYHNCKQYGSNYKPEGLIQKNASKLRYAAFGYLNEYTKNWNDPILGSAYQLRDGGVLRAAMTYVGPTQPVPGSVPITNPAPEWNATTGVMIDNPAPTDATQTVSDAGTTGITVSKSGVINYLNKFGFESRGKYKSFSDPVGELYYAAMRYLRGMGEVPEYSNYPSGTTQATKNEWIDGFPVINNWATRGDPVLYSCQKNFILGIGDIITHKDRNLPGVTSSFRTGGKEPAMPSMVSADTLVNVDQATDKIGVMEGKSGDFGTQKSSPTDLSDSNFIAGLAYFAHTNDIRPEMPGKQTISTFWMDVMEVNSSYPEIPSTGYYSKNKYWLAAKYGGFDVPKDFNYATRTAALPLSWWNNGNELVTGSTTDYRPTNYFTANDPADMKSGLEEAFAKIVSEAAGASATSYATTSPNVNTGGASYGSSYSPDYWTGDVIASSVTYAADGALTRLEQWRAGAKLDAAANASATWWTDTRKVITYCDGTLTGIRFTSDALTTCQAGQGATGRLNYSTFERLPGSTATPTAAVAATNAANMVAYLRGDRTQETVYRSRKSLLGDIINSKLNPVAAPTNAYSDTYNPGYSSFKTLYSARKPVVYVGANDGMLHAFNGELTGTEAGKELFAFIPSFVYGSATTGPVSGLASLGNPSFVHHNLVDATARHFDVDINRTVGATVTTPAWRTILIGGLGKGGRGYYALDVTNPSDWTTETAVAGKVMWEFPRSDDATTRARMGYSYGEPSVVKTKKHGWVVIFSSGYNNDDGKGYFFVVNPRTGDLLETIATPDGSVSTPLNMGHQQAYIPDYADYTSDAVYAGDLRGNLWRLDLTTTTGSYAAPVKIAQLTNAAGNALPVTTRPLIEVDPSSKKRYVLVGTGRLLDETDITSQPLQSFYAIVDGTAQAGGFWATPPSSTFPITRSGLNANNTLTTGIGSSPTSAFGWYFDLASTSVTSGGVTSTIAERVISDPDANAGVVAFAANEPNGDACNPSGKARIFAVRFATGKTVLTDNAGNLITSVSNSTGMITDIALQKVNGRLRLNIGDSGGEARNVPGNMSSSVGLTRLNWREVPSQD